MIRQLASPNSMAQEFHTSKLEMQLTGERVGVVVSTPGAPVDVGVVLPVLHQLSVECETRARDNVERNGQEIRCRAGCGACCRQLVPVLEIEASRLAKLVDEMPEPRRSEVRGRFAAAKVRLDEAGIGAYLLHLDDVPAAKRTPFALDYFYLGIPCPFLENESCSIYADRPLVCREYMVTSAPENCKTPTAETVDMIDMPARISKAVRGIDKSTTTGAMPRVALTMALEFAATQPDSASPRLALEWLTAMLPSLQIWPIDPES